MKYFYPILFILWLIAGCHIRSLLAQSGPPWIKTNVGVNYILRGIDFPDNQSTVGFIAGESLTYNGNGIVLKTTNGGDTWSSIWTGTNMGIEGSCFVDVNTGFIAGWPNLTNGWSGFGRTTDGGVTWTSPPVSANLYFLTDVVFKDANNGIIIGSTNTSALVYVTSNGGNTWTPASGIAGGMPQHACYVSGNTYFLVDNNGHIQKSVNNGLNWVTVHTIPGLILTGIDFFNDLTGMASGDNGVISRTSDGGNTWQNQMVGSDIWRDFGWETQDHLFCCGTPEIVAESNDGGATWTNGFPGSTFQAALYECIFTENGKGFICGSQGTLLKRQPSCTAAFSASSTGICAGDQVAYQSQSIGNISTYSWYFEGGSPSTSTLPNPIVTYPGPGSFDVRLEVNNGYWTDTLRMTDYITVNQSPTPVISLNGIELTSNITTGNQWYRSGTAVPGANGQTHIAAESGWYWDVVTENGCESDTSNNIYVLMTGMNENTGNDVRVIVNEDDGSLVFITGINGCMEYSVSLFNPVGKRILFNEALIASDNGNLSIRTGPLNEPFYIFKLTSGRLTLTGKFIPALFK